MCMHMSVFVKCFGAKPVCFLNEINLKLKINIKNHVEHLEPRTNTISRSSVARRISRTYLEPRTNIRRSI